MLALFHDKKCCNCNKLFPCIFVRFYCIKFSIKLMKNQACNEDQCSFVTSSRVKVPGKRLCLKHMIRS